MQQQEQQVEQQCFGQYQVMAAAETHPDPRAEALEKHGCQHPALHIAAFNIQIFGDTKYEKEGVLDVLLQILSRYDLVLIQEIRDKAKHPSKDLAPDSFKYLVRDLNDFLEDDSTYDYVISERLGRGHSKEQYAYVYRTDKLSVTDTYQSYDFEHFERPPFSVRFSAPNCEVEDFALIGCHVDPDTVPVELEAMYDIYEEVVAKWDVENLMLMGDFNAGGSYISLYELEQLRLRKDKRFHWLISDVVDTTVKGTCYAYDRMIAFGEAFSNSVIENSSKPFKYDEVYGLNRELAEDVSDHYPIETMVYGKVKQRLHDAFNTSLRLSVDMKATEGASSEAVEMLSAMDEEDTIAGFTVDCSRTRIVLSQEDVSNVVETLMSFNEQCPGVFSPEVVSGAESYMAAMKHKVRMPRIHSVTGDRTGLYDVTIEIHNREPYNYRLCINITE